MILWEEILAVMLGGALGALSRFLISRFAYLVLPKAFPWGTLLANLLGCLLMGLLMGLLAERYSSPFWQAGIFVGFLGALTTFSSFSMQTVALFQDGAYLAGSLNVIGSLGGCLFATALGLFLARMILIG